MKIEVMGQTSDRTFMLKARLDGYELPMRHFKFFPPIRDDKKLEQILDQKFESIGYRRIGGWQNWFREKGQTPQYYAYFIKD